LAADSRGRGERKGKKAAIASAVAPFCAVTGAFEKIQEYFGRAAASEAGVFARKIAGRVIGLRRSFRADGGCGGRFRGLLTAIPNGGIGFFFFLFQFPSQLESAHGAPPQCARMDRGRERLKVAILFTGVENRRRGVALGFGRIGGGCWAKFAPKMVLPRQGLSRRGVENHRPYPAGRGHTAGT